MNDNIQIRALRSQAETAPLSLTSAVASQVSCHVRPLLPISTLRRLSPLSDILPRSLGLGEVSSSHLQCFLSSSGHAHLRLTTSPMSRDVCLAYVLAAVLASRCVLAAGLASRCVPQFSLGSEVPWFGMLVLPTMLIQRSIHCKILKLEMDKMPVVST